MLDGTITITLYLEEPKDKNIIECGSRVHF